MASIHIDGLTKVYPGGVTAIDGLDLTIEDGSFFALLGPSGCGKTTLLRTIAGLEAVSAGTIHIAERDVTVLPPGDRNVAMVFQDYALFPHMSVNENIAYPLRIKKTGRSERTLKATETGTALGLEALMERRPAELSGGQQQRVALARAMACQPSVFLLDEPLSNLDARLRLEARSFLKRLQRELGVTTVFVTHDQSEALAMADQIAVMEKGRIRQLGTPSEIFRSPSNTFVANFIGSTPMNLLPGVLRGGTLRVGSASVGREAAGELAAWSAGAVDSGEVTVAFRPEYARVDGDGPLRFTGTVETLENLGASVLVTVRTGDDQRVQAVVPEGEEVDVGAGVHVAPVPGRILVYDARGELLRP
ncbi:ABC transporter [Humibacillus sp. DSM 29435]|uniref:ABC transporter ATP-binding protein n=1 Tax=Humibacillus sp. DSM 29435 TaxID=1869167 RepID=UPI000872459A|nr:ABC transporter ATP-binding protein [Humibacillus sp. DSM 29435]OFE16422.1 ABC transporter [Humibacillus sp. DSM 29435]